MKQFFPDDTETQVQKYLRQLTYMNERKSMKVHGLNIFNLLADLEIDVVFTPDSPCGYLVKNGLKIIDKCYCNLGENQLRARNMLNNWSPYMSSSSDEEA